MKGSYITPFGPCSLIIIIYFFLLRKQNKTKQKIKIKIKQLKNKKKINERSLRLIKMLSGLRSRWMTLN